MGRSRPSLTGYFSSQLCPDAGFGSKKINSYFPTADATRSIHRVPLAVYLLQGIMSVIF